MAHVRKILLISLRKQLTHNKYCLDPNSEEDSVEWSPPTSIEEDVPLKCLTRECEMHLRLTKRLKALDRCKQYKWATGWYPVTVGQGDIFEYKEKLNTLSCQWLSSWPSLAATWHPLHTWVSKPSNCWTIWINSRISCSAPMTSCCAKLPNSISAWTNRSSLNIRNTQRACCATTWRWSQRRWFLAAHKLSSSPGSSYSSYAGKRLSPRV